MAHAHAEPLGLPCPSLPHRGWGGPDRVQSHVPLQDCVRLPPLETLALGPQAAWDGPSSNL